MRRVEVAVVGAGIVGLLTALELVERGVDLAVLEASTVASGASGGVGMRGVRANGRHPAELPLMARAYELWPLLEQRVGAPTGYERTGQLHVTERAEDLPALAEQAARQNKAGVASEVIDAAAVRELEPHISDAVVGAVWCPHDGSIDHTATCLAVADALTSKGVTVVERAPVVGLAPTSGGLLIEADRVDELAARKVVLAANTAVGALAAPLGLRLETFNVFPQVLVVEPPTGGLVRHLVGHHHRRVILKSLPTGDVMITGGWLGRLDPATGRGVTLDEQVSGNLDEAVALYPGLEGSGLVSAVADRAEAVTPDLLPIVDRTSNEHVAVATGWSGHGFAIAPAVAEGLADWATTDAWPVELAPFRADRFDT